MYTRSRRKSYSWKFGDIIFGSLFLFNVFISSFLFITVIIQPVGYLVFRVIQMGFLSAERYSLIDIESVGIKYFCFIYFASCAFIIINKNFVEFKIELKMKKCFPVNLPCTVTIWTYMTSAQFNAEEGCTLLQ